MFKMVGYCGLVCSTCPTFLATKNDDDLARRRTVVLYAEKFGFDLKPEDINWEGCRSAGDKLIGFCRACDIRRCCRGRGLNNCALCDEQPCENLLQFHRFSKDAKDAFEGLKQEIERDQALRP